jgi:glycosyltransferase involved in cell wall biosynthesis
MKILRIIARLNIGGPARNAVLLSQGFSTRCARSNNILRAKDASADGVEKITYNTVLVCGEVSEGEGDMTYLAREKGIEPVIVKELGRELSFANDWTAFWKIFRIVCREKPDIIHTHTAKAGTLGRLAGILYNSLYFCSRLKAQGSKKIKLVHTFHGHFFHSYFGKVKTFVFAVIEKALAVFTDRIITVSKTLEKELVDGVKIAPGNKFRVVELGFELDELLKIPLRDSLFRGNDTLKVNIGIIGRLVPIKNHRMLLKAAKQLKAEGSGLKVKFIVIGDGELRRELEEFAEGLGISDIVEFRGWMKDLNEIYSELDIVVLTSLNEGTPVSIIEAMAAGRPVVSTNVGGVPDIMEDGKSGYLVKSGDDKAFADKIMDLTADGEKRKNFGSRGRELVKDRFSKDRLIKDTFSVYEELW